MSTSKPNKNDNPQNDVDESDALKQAILKLKQSGMLTYVPDDLADIVTEETPSSDAQSDAETPVASDAKTIPSRPTKETPLVAESSVDGEQVVNENADLATFMSAWDVDVADATVSENEDATDAENDSWQLATPLEDEVEKSVDEQAAITLRRKEIKPHTEESALTGNREKTPWALQQFFDGEIDLEQELLKRFPAVPVMTTIKFRTLGLNSTRKVATLSSQDGGASLIVDADMETKVVQLSFTFGSMLTLRYVLSDLPANNRERWLELMRREKGGLAFLWNEDRWREDYLICVSREYSTNIFAFSPRHFESAVRITKNITAELLAWLEDVWVNEPETKSDDDAPLLTW